jgi:hypothetical protein
LVFGDTHEFSKSLLNSSRNIRVSKEHFSFVCNGSISEGGHESGILVGFVTSEKNSSWLLLSEDSFDLVLGEFENGWNHQWLNEVNK